MRDIFKGKPVVAALKSGSDIPTVCGLDIDIVFMLSANINDLGAYMKELKKHEKRVFLHIDLINGLRADKEGLRYLKEAVAPFGIISTKVSIIRQAAQLGLKTVFRIFMVDTLAYDTGLSSINACQPDYVEVMPGVVFDVIRQAKGSIGVPIIAGGMIKTIEEAGKALDSGATAISSTNHKIWREFSY